MSKPFGKLTTHVLNTTLGRPAAGVELTLWRQNGDQWTQVATAITTADGRTETPLLAGDAFLAGTYELRFQIGDYFQSLGVDAGTIPFLDEVPLRFGVSDPGANYHVPLLVTPWSYSTYRGS